MHHGTDSSTTRLGLADKGLSLVYGTRTLHDVTCEVAHLDAVSFIVGRDLMPAYTSIIV